MNLVERVLVTRREQLGLDRLGLPAHLSCLFVTPRFRTSRHVIALIAPAGSDQPCLVAKLPRRVDDDAGLRREWANLSRLQELWPQGRGSYPETILLDHVDGQPVLIETAVHGKALHHRAVRRNPQRMIALVEEWLDGLPVTGASCDDGAWFDRMVGAPLRAFARRAALGDETRRLVDQTLRIVDPLGGARFPLVFEHGDLTHPNLLVAPGDHIGVVDWELSQPQGLPVHDYCLFLAFVAFSLAGVHDRDGQVRAFESAFIGPRPWALPMIARRLTRLSVDARLLAPFVVACWARYVAELLPRLIGTVRGEATATNAGTEALSNEAAALVQQDRDLALWRCAVWQAEAMAAATERLWDAGV
ncbi:MAG TPA: phosphotransferase [Actinomycetes bacterium]